MVASLIYNWFGLHAIPWKVWSKAKAFPALVSSVPFTTLYGTVGKSEFVLCLAPTVQIRIECKWQQVTGSVDEKYPYLLECMKHVPENRVIIVYGGGGAKPAAIQWLRTEAKRVEHKAIAACSIEEFAVIVSRLRTEPLATSEEGSQDQEVLRASAAQLAYSM